MSKYCCDEMDEAVNKETAYEMSYCPFCGTKLHQEAAPESEKLTTPADRCRAAADKYEDGHRDE